MKADAEKAIQELEDLESEKAMEDEAAYEAELQQATASVNQLALDVEAASAAAEAAAADGRRRQAK